jgi:hypothetical protein
MIKFIVVVTIGILISIVFAEWAAGCGEVTYFPDRTWRLNECLYISSEMRYGKW